MMPPGQRLNPAFQLAGIATGDKTLHMTLPTRCLRILTAVILFVTSFVQQARAAEPISVMTFNIRYASAFGANSWPKRRGGVVQVIRDQKPDLIGTQEGLHHQLLFMDKELPKYAWIGLGREGGKRGEFMAVFYRPERFKPLAHKHFWLSDTPEVVGSASWGNTVKRMVTWVHFLDQKNNRKLFFWNTHFDHQSQPSREKSAQLINKKIADLKTDHPIILEGDFNASAKANYAYRTLTIDGGFHVTFLIEKE